jgi:hypothetical protein
MCAETVVNGKNHSRFVIRESGLRVGRDLRRVARCGTLSASRDRRSPLSNLMLLHD